MEEKSPHIAFADIAGLTDRELQMLLREVDTYEVGVAIKGMKKAFQDRILGNVSPRVKERISAVGKVANGEVEKRRARMVDVVRQLVEAGQVGWPPGKQARAIKPGRQYLANKKPLETAVQRPLCRMTPGDLDGILVGLTEVARAEGIMAMEALAQKTEDPFLKKAIEMAVDGTEPQLIAAMLSTWMASLMHQHEVQYRKVIEGIMAIQSGDNPDTIVQKLALLY